MNIAHVQGRGWEPLVSSGLSVIVNTLISGREVWLVESEICIGEFLLQKIRDDLLIHHQMGNIKYIKYEECLSQLYLYQGDFLPDHTTTNPLIINLSFVWSFEFTE